MIDRIDLEISLLCLVEADRLTAGCPAEIGPTATLPHIFLLEGFAMARQGEKCKENQNDPYSIHAYLRYGKLVPLLVYS
jgi:hypothetical protein